MIVDDELPAIINLQWALGQYPHWHLVASCRTSADARAVLGDTVVDLLLLDIRMPGQSGLDFARELCQRASPPVVVFVTAFDQHAVAAFDLFALDYILKPFDDERFALMLRRVEQHLALHQQAALSSSLQAYLREREADAAGHAPPPLRQLTVRTLGGIERIDATEVLWVGSAGNYVELHLARRVILHRATVSAICARLPDQQFMRVHRTALVRIDALRSLKVDAAGTYSAQLANGDSVPVSSRYLKQVQAVFG